MRRGHFLINLIAFVCLGGCSASRAQNPPATKPAVSAFDHEATGTIHGAVTWTGEAPVVPEFVVYGPMGPRQPNPHAPRIDVASFGVEGAVVFLRKVDPAKSRPWDHAPVLIEMKDRKLKVFQGVQSVTTAFVQRSASIQMVSRDPFLQSLRAKGASYFTLPFQEKDLVATRRLDHDGEIELSSAVGSFWMGSHLFVSEHPYFTRSDPKGLFALEDVPAGQYDLVCWLPNWNVDHIDYDPESHLPWRVYYKKPLEKSVPVVVEVGGLVAVEYSVDSASFAK